MELVVQPSPIVFSSLNEAQRVLVLGIADSGEKLDLGHAAEIKPQSDVVKIGEDGFLQALRVGETNVLVSAAGRSVSVPVTVKALDKPTQVNFLREVLPVLNKVGCTQGTCHGAAKGKNGFKLSLRGYDPEFDYHALLYDMSGRRFNRANPCAQLDAGQADSAGCPRRWTEDRNRVPLLQPDSQLDLFWCAVRRPGVG